MWKKADADTEQVTETETQSTEVQEVVIETPGNTNLLTGLPKKI